MFHNLIRNKCVKCNLNILYLKGKCRTFKYSSCMFSDDLKQFERFLASSKLRLWEYIIIHFNTILNICKMVIILSRQFIILRIFLRISLLLQHSTNI